MMFREKSFTPKIWKRVKNLLKEINSLEILDGRRFAFSLWLWPFDLSASAIMPHRILFSFEWCHRLFHADKDVRDAFLFAVGHELTHKKGFYTHETNNLKEGSFLQWSMEEFCDFGSLYFYCKDRDRAVNGIEYMVKEKPKNRDGIRYPGWKTRRDYIAGDNFNEEFIRKTAEIKNCTNEELIQCVINHYMSFIDDEKIKDI